MRKGKDKEYHAHKVNTTREAGTKRAGGKGHRLDFNIYPREKYKTIKQWAMMMRQEKLYRWSNNIKQRIWKPDKSRIQRGSKENKKRDKRVKIT